MIAWLFQQAGSEIGERGRLTLVMIGQLDRDDSGAAGFANLSGPIPAIAPSDPIPEKPVFVAQFGIGTILTGLVVFFIPTPSPVAEVNPRANP